MAPDARAKKILFNHYWTSAGWRREPSPTTTKEDIQYAKACGVMFDPLVVTHSETWRRLPGVVRSLSRRDVAAGFVASLSNRRVEWRSALGTWSIFQHASAHPRAAGLHERCEVCGQIEGEELADLSILSFERLKWGGVRHLDPSYALLDLELFGREPVEQPGKDDVQRLRQAIQTIRNAPPDTTAATLHRLLAPAFPSNKAERNVFIGILGFCGVLEVNGHPGFRNRFIKHTDRRLPDRHYVDMSYPACWWTARDGVNEEALSATFGPFL